MNWPTAGEWFLIVILWLLFSFLAGFVETWREQGKWNKKYRRENNEK